MTKKSKGKGIITQTIPWQYEYNILRIPYQEFIDSIEEMPFKLLMHEYRSHCEYRGTKLNSKPEFSKENSTDLYKRIIAIEDLLEKCYHRLSDAVEASQYWENENWKHAQKEKEKNVKVSNKSTKQTKQS